MRRRRAKQATVVDGDAIEREMLAEARAEVGIADAKASLLLAALGIGFGALLGGLIAGQWVPGDLQGYGPRVWWVGAAFALASVSLSACAVWPRFVRTDAKEGVHYWGHVATFKRLQDLVAALDSAYSVSGWERRRTRHQLWRLSRLVAKKYTFVRLAIISAMLAVVALLLALALGQ